MDDLLPTAIWPALRCPACGGPFAIDGTGATCTACRLRYDRSAHGVLDLRLRRPKVVQNEVVLGTPLLPDAGFAFDVLERNEKPEVDFSGLDIPLSEILLTYFPKASTPQAMALDIGCGDVIHRSACEQAGFQYVGIDYQTAKAPMLADGHALPFADRTFDFVLSFAVLEHIQHPQVMMKEAFRVLKENGTFIGVVAFSEPFHQGSFYHHTHLGTYNSIRQAGFEVVKVSPSPNWRALQAHATMSLFPKMPTRLAFALVAPIDWLHRIWWWLGNRFDGEADEATRVLRSTGCFEFIARRPPDVPPDVRSSATCSPAS